MPNQTRVRFGRVHANNINHLFFHCLTVTHACMQHLQWLIEQEEYIASQGTHTLTLTDNNLWAIRVCYSNCVNQNPQCIHPSNENY